MTDVAVIKISIGVPEVGTPSVFAVTIQKQDSLGPVERSPTETEQYFIVQALLSYMLTLFA